VDRNGLVEEPTRRLPGRCHPGIELHVAARLIPLDKTGWLGNGLTFVSTCLLSVGLAWLLRRAVESPCIEFGRRWSRRIVEHHTAATRRRTVFVGLDGEESSETASLNCRDHLTSRV
jgi:hypothetical protein